MIRPAGVYSAMLTPWKNGVPDLAELRKIVDFQINAGLTGLFPVSSVGESGLMSFEQKCSLMETVIDQAAGRVAAHRFTAGQRFAHGFIAVQVDGHQ